MRNAIVRAMCIVALAVGLLSVPANVAAAPSSTCVQLKNCPGGAVPAESEPRGSENYTTYEYLSWAVSSADVAWTKWFIANGLREPEVFVWIIEPGDPPYVTRCSGDEPPTTATYPNAFYCPADVTSYQGKLYTGAIVLPLTTFENMWDGNIFSKRSGVKGDFAAGVIVAHEFGHHVQDEIALQVGIKDARYLPAGKYKELLADCFAGNWASEVYHQRNLDPDDLSEALAALSVIGDAKVTDNDHGTASERRTAFMYGFNGSSGTVAGGTPFQCLRAYWPELGA